MSQNTPAKVVHHNIWAEGLQKRENGQDSNVGQACIRAHADVRSPKSLVWIQARVAEKATGREPVA